MMRVPEFFAGAATICKTEDLLTYDGAHKLASIIRARWAECGHSVQTFVIQEGLDRGNGLFVVRTNLLNGLPPVPIRPAASRAPEGSSLPSDANRGTSPVATSPALAHLAPGPFI